MSDVRPDPETVEALAGLAEALSCGQRGQAFAERACGPTHAAIAADPRQHRLIAPLLAAQPARDPLAAGWVDLLFTTAPHAEGEFVEAEDESGRGVRCGEWLPPTTDQFWRLRIPVNHPARDPLGDAAAVQRALALHEPIRVYDECDHGDDHGCEPIEVYDYTGCSESVIGWACRTCCYDDEYLIESCPHGADHRGVAKAHACPTAAALAPEQPEPETGHPVKTTGGCTCVPGICSEQGECCEAHECQAAPLTDAVIRDVTDEEDVVIARAASLLEAIYQPGGVLIYWSSRITYLDNRRPCDLWAERDLDALTKMCDRLETIADGNFA